ncbi:MAG: hypothetical protein A3G91_01340 [Omnitrophica WOR_2 bacterium RIFCSPLOWO2_12_FULL_50_9]|nr:MAG: hypothetical protein A3G91_01340 [Omnitrophica WOR_2 bacterium RIFCSPLOWO2_12_FULL_50_9]
MILPELSKMMISSRNTTRKFILLITCVLLFLIIGRFFHIDERWCKSLLTETPLAVSGIIFIVLYVVLTSLIWLGPKDFFRITAALIYGAYVSTLLVYISEVINAFIFFTFSRKLGRGFVESRLRGKMRHIDETTADTSFWWIFAMRLFIVPFRFLDMGCGLSKISFAKYFSIVLIATPFRLFLFQYLLTLGFETVRNPSKLAEHFLENPWVLWMNFLYLVGAATVLFFLRRKKPSRQNLPTG